MSTVALEYNIHKLNLKKLTPYICGICKKIYANQELYQCPNGHLAHQECWEFDSGIYKCNFCEVSNNSDNSHPFLSLQINKLANQLLSKFIVSCPYRFINITHQQLEIDEINGCTETVKIKNLDTHTTNCIHRFMHCENQVNGCSEIMRFNQYEQHIKTCEFQKSKCQLCNSDFIINQVQEHLDKCPSFPVNCKQCQEEVKRGKEELHLKDECKNSFIICGFFGCQKIVSRGLLSNHMTESMNSHLLLLGTSVTNISNQLKQLSLQDQLLSKIDKLQSELNNLPNQIEKALVQSIISHVSCAPIEYKNSWIINKYSNIKELESPEIKINIFSLFLEIKKNDQYKFLKLYIKKKENYPLSIKLSITLTNLNPGGENFSRYIIYDEDMQFQKDYGLGINPFISYKQLEDNFIQKDTLKFDFTIEIFKKKQVFVSN